MQSNAVKYLTAEQRDIAYEAGKAAYDQKQAQAREKRAAKGTTPQGKEGHCEAHRGRYRRQAV